MIIIIKTIIIIIINLIMSSTYMYNNASPL